MHAAVQTTLFLASDGCDVTGIQGQNPLSLLDERNPPFIVYYYNHRAFQSCLLAALYKPTEWMFTGWSAGTDPVHTYSSV